VALEGFDIRKMAFGGREREVIISSSAGPPVVILHEIFGLSVSLVTFARLVEAGGFRIYMPVLFGSAEPKSGKLGKAKGVIEFLCVAQQFRAFSANESGPWADWLRALVDWACADSGYQKAGAIGLCLTGNFALSMAVNDKVKAPVMGEPSLPFMGDGLHVTPDELAAVKQRVSQGLEIRAYRFATDTICKAGLFQKLEAELAPGFKGTTLPAEEKLHSVFTEDLRDAGGGLRHDKVQEVIDFLRNRLT
jgi:dienelactone hydrolase